jgi:CoA:oxalate CoA-transferase
VTSAGSSSRPLDGYRVLDLSRVVSGPLCGRLLADLGAEVVKIEPPTGDVTRTVLPFVSGMSPYFAQMNAGKRNVSLDLKAPGAADVVARLADRADVLVENFRPGVLERLGLGADALRARNRGLVYCSVSGWGQHGPWRDRRAYAPLVHAQAGTIELAARMRGRAPEQEVHVHGDVYSALLAANAVLAALLERARSGVGRHVDVAMGEAMLYVNDWAAVELQRWDGDRTFDIWTHPVFRLADGSAAALVGNPTRMFASWVRALGGDEALLDDARFATRDAIADHEDEALAVLADLAARVLDFPTLEAALDAWPMFVAEVRSVAELADTEWAAERGVVQEISPGLPVPAAPWRTDGAAVGVTGPAARRGEHNREVLVEAGFTDDDVDALLATGVLCAEAIMPTAGTPTIAAAAPAPGS